MTPRNRQVLLVCDSADADSRSRKANVVSALRSARLRFDEVNLSLGAEWPDLSAYGCVMLLVGVHEKLDDGDTDRVREYLTGGGGLVIAFEAWEQPPLDLVGLAAPLPPNAAARIESTTLTIEKELLPDTLDLTFPLKLELGKVDLISNASVVARGSSGVPVIWDHAWGGGRVVVCQASLFSWRVTRGLVVASIMATQATTVRPIANAAAIQVDDFPCAASTAMLSPVDEEYGLSLLDFYDRVWLPDMLDLADRHGYLYTFLLVFNYNATTTAPFDFAEWEHARKPTDGGGDEPFAVNAARRVVEKHELGLHGYNHVSLELSDWPTKTDMAAAAMAAAERWVQDGLGPLPVTYVPPENRYDAAGLEAVTTAFDTIEVVCPASNRALGYGYPEFGPEAYNPRLYCLPRDTAGYLLTDHEKFKIVSQLYLTGIWTHYLHPDDIVDSPATHPTRPRYRNADCLFWRSRAPDGSAGLLEQFDNLVAFVRRHSPWIRFERTADAFRLVRRHYERGFEAHISQHEIEVRAEPNVYFQVQADAAREIDIGSISGGELVDVREFDSFRRYTLLSHAPLVRIALHSV